MGTWCSLLFHTYTYIYPDFREDVRTANIIAYDSDGVTCLGLDREWVTVSLNVVMYMYIIMYSILVIENIIMYSILVIENIIMYSILVIENIIMYSILVIEPSTISDLHGIQDWSGSLIQWSLISSIILIQQSGDLELGFHNLYAT